MVDRKEVSFGDLLHVRPSNATRSRAFVMPSSTTQGATDIIMNTSDPAGWKANMDVAQMYYNQGFGDMMITWRPIVEQQGRLQTPYEKEDHSNAPMIEELDDDAQEELWCEACKTNIHETRDCPVPSHDGSTAIDLFCNFSIKSQEKGDKIRHTLDGLRALHPSHRNRSLYCNVLIDLSIDRQMSVCEGSLTPLWYRGEGYHPSVWSRKHTVSSGSLLMFQTSVIGGRCRHSWRVCGHTLNGMR